LCGCGWFVVALLLGCGWVGFWVWGVLRWVFGCGSCVGFHFSVWCPVRFGLVVDVGYGGVSWLWLLEKGSELFGRCLVNVF
jgi:hypothetical protein